MLSEQVSVLVRNELKLARLEMTSKGKQAAFGTGMFGVSGVTAVYGVGCLLACAIIAISGAVAAWLAALIVGAALLAAAGCAALLGRRRLAEAAPPVTPMAANGVRSNAPTLGSTMKPRISVVRVMPTCAADSCVDNPRSEARTGRARSSPSSMARWTE